MTSFQVLLALHVLGGSLALLVGPVSMLARKGGPLHRRAGLVFSAAMAAGSASAFMLALIVGNTLLLTIAVLTGFLIFTGVRAAWFRRGLPPGWSDGAAWKLMAGFGAWLLWRSAASFDATGLFFGAGSLALAARQRHLLRAVRPEWLPAHIAGMGGAYVATLNAFLVVNFSYLPKPVIFIMPAAVGTMAIVWAISRYAGRPALQAGRS